MKNLPSVLLNYKMTPEQSFKELHNEYSLEKIDDSLFAWFSDHMAQCAESISGKEASEQHHLFYLIRKAIHQTQRIANDNTISVPELSRTITVVGDVTARKIDSF